MDVTEAGVLMERVRTLLRASAGEADVVAHEQVTTALDRLEAAPGDRARIADAVTQIREYADRAMMPPEGDAEDEDAGPAGEPASLDMALAAVDLLERAVRDGG